MGDEIIKRLNDQGIVVEKINKVKDEDLLETGYKKINAKNVEHLDALLQYIPEILADTATRKSAGKNAAKMLDGAYKVSIKDGMHLAMSKDTPGAYIGGLLSDETNQVAGQARLFKIGEKLTISKIPQFAMNVFNVISVATGQYYLSEINSRLDNIEKSTKKIADYLETKERSELWANNELLNEIVMNLPYLDNERMRSQYCNTAREIKGDSLAKMKQFEIEIKDNCKSINKKSSDEEIQKYVSETLNNYPKYWFSVLLYIKSAECELLLNNVTNPNHILNAKKEVEKHVSRYEKNYINDKNKMLDIVNNSKTYNRLELETVHISTHGEIPVLDLIVSGYNLFAIGKNANASKMSDKKQELIHKVKGEMNKCSNLEYFKNGIEQIDEYHALWNNRIDLISYNNDIYVKYKEEED